MVNYTSQRVGVFVDVQNMYYSARALFDKRVNFGGILEEALGDRQLIRALAYVVRADIEEEQGFFDALAKSGYELRVKDILVYFGGKKKGDWDVGIAMDTIRLAPKLDVIVLVSGDGDYEALVDHLQSMGCRVEVMAFGKSTSSKLRDAADKFIDLSAEPEKYLMTSPRSRAIAAQRGILRRPLRPTPNAPTDIQPLREGMADFGDEEK